MLQPAFNIGSADAAPGARSSHLLVELSAQSFNYILYAKDPFELLLLRQYRLYTTGDKSLRDLIEEVAEGDEVIRQHAGNAVFVYNFPEASIIPGHYYHPEINDSISRLMYGEDGSELVFREQIKDTDMHNVYRVPKEIHSMLKEKFTGSQYWHIYTLMLLSPDVKQHSTENNIHTVFYHDHFIAAYFANNGLQLIQTFHYQTPEDAAYYLLLICRQFNINQKDMSLTVSGLIDSQSALYAELLKYFPEVKEDGIPEEIKINGLLEEFPGHYFSPLLKMSLCGL